MKIKRKLYPSSPDKEFVLMSVNDLRALVLNSHFKVVENQTPITFAFESTLDNMVSQFNLKTPASHLKKTKKQKTEENANA